MSEENSWYKAQYIITYQDNCRDYAVTIRSEENRQNSNFMSGKAKLDIDTVILNAITTSEEILPDSVANTECEIIIKLNHEPVANGTMVDLSITATGNPDRSHNDLQNQYFSKIAREIQKNVSIVIPAAYCFNTSVIH